MAMTRSVVVGVDGSPQSLGAARFGAALAGRRGLAVRLLHGYLHPFGYGSLSLSAYDPAVPDPRPEARRMLADAVAIVRSEHPSVDVSAAQVAAGGAAALVEASGEAAAVVVGHRGLGGFAELVLGSVGSQVAAHASCPVVVVRPQETERGGAPVVVGVDGSVTGDAALAFAFEEAAARSVPLVAVHVATDPTDGAAAYTESLLASTVAPWTAKHPDVEFGLHVRPGIDAEEALVDASADACLVVVGSRGRGGFTGLLLGSVSQALVHHARCPVAVVHPGAPDPAS